MVNGTPEASWTAAKAPMLPLVRTTRHAAAREQVQPQTIDSMPKTRRYVRDPLTSGGNGYQRRRRLPRAVGRRSPSRCWRHPRSRSRARAGRGKRPRCRRRARRPPGRARTRPRRARVPLLVPAALVQVERDPDRAREDDPDAEVPELPTDVEREHRAERLAREARRAREEDRAEARLFQELALGIRDGAGRRVTPPASPVPSVSCSSHQATLNSAYAMP